MVSARGWLLAGVSALVLIGASDVGVALAAAPEAPQMKVESHTATSASVSGVLSPNSPGQEGTYEYLYAASPTTCTGEGRTQRGLSFGFQGEGVSAELTGLSPHTTYTVCLLDRDLAGEETLSEARTFTTSLTPEAPETGVAESIASSAAILHGALNPNSSRKEEPGFYEFLYKRSLKECEGGASTGRLPVEPAVLHGEQKEAVQAEVGELAPNVTYTFCVRAWNATGQYETGSPVTFTTLSRSPAVSEESVPTVGSTTATVSARLDTGGIATSYDAEYGTTSAYGAQAAGTPVAEGVQTVTVELAGLEPGTEYHFRFTVSNADGTMQGGDVAFDTRPVGLGALPDGRTWEMVSPPEDHDALTNFPVPVYSGFYTRRPYQASANGKAVVYESDPTTGGFGRSVGNAQLSSRNAEGGWTQTAIQPSAFELGGDGAYQAFSSDLSKGVFETPALPVLAPGAPSVPLTDRLGYNVLYEHGNLSNTWSSLITTTPPNRGPYRLNGELVSKYKKFGTAEIGANLEGPEEGKTLVYAGASADFGHLLFEADDSLLEGGGALAQELDGDVKQEIQEKRDTNELYMFSGGRAELINVLPDGKADPNATFGAQQRQSGWPPVVPNFSHVISADGSRIFWTDLNTGIVYVREEGAHTIQISEGSAKYLTASSDGRYTFYIEGEKLYRFGVETESREQIAGVGVEGFVGASEDGSRLYFVATGALASGAMSGQPNLYEWHEGSVSLVATLGVGDSNDWYPDMGNRDADVTPDGQAATFMSMQNLTGYATEGHQEVYVYESEAGGLFCASCSPTHTPGASGFLGLSNSNTYVPRSISADGGRVFFDSYASLLPQDTDGSSDVYEWERDGTGSCVQPVGCLYLLSGGAGGSAFVDASESGDDAFFVTEVALVPGDPNELVDLYDAHVGIPVSPTLCSGTGCQGPPAPPPTFATPASVTFSGVGNFLPPSGGTSGRKSSNRGMLSSQAQLRKALEACKAKRPRARKRCEATARRRYDKAAKRVTSARRRGR